VSTTTFGVVHGTEVASVHIGPRTWLSRFDVLVAEWSRVLQVELCACAELGHPVCREGLLDEHDAVALVLCS
jgi:hypothetical protein